MAITIKGRESMSIPEGAHPAKIKELKVEKRGKEQFEYLDIHVDVMDVTTKAGTHPSIKLGMPFDLTVNTKLGKTLRAFGVSDEQIASGESLNIEKVLAVGREVRIVTTNVETDKGTFADISSMKPA